jgi:anaerobic ribonucleoside-triphosphate reductase activating protein
MVWQNLKIASTQYSIIYNSFEIYLSGCMGNPKCEKCYNKELWDFSIGENYTKEYFDKIKKKINRFDKIINNIFVLGGEPLDQEKEEFLVLINNLKSMNKMLWLFTRYELKDIDKNILNLFDYVKTGKYIPNLASENNLKYEIKLATSNQTINKKGIDY